MIDKIIKNKNIIWLSVSLALLFSVSLAVPTHAGNASLYLSPSTGTYNIGSNFFVSIKINSGGVPINAAEASLTFNPEKLRVISISRANSIFTLWTNEPTFSNTAGTINFGGGTPINFTGTTGRIITITFRGRKDAIANVNFVSGAILAADGRGTNILDNMRNGIYTLRPAIITPPVEDEEEIEVPVAPITDTEPPKHFEIEIDNEGDPTNPTPILKFKTTDKISGIDFYEIRIGDQEPIRITPKELVEKPFRLSFQKPGKHSVIIRAVDRAGNYTISLKDFIIKGIEPPIITEFPTKLKKGDFLILKGTSDPNWTILVYVQKEQDIPMFKEIRADEQGNWQYVHKQKVTEGIYTIWAKNKDLRGAISQPTEKIAIPVTIPPFLQFGRIAIDYLVIIVTLILLIIGTIAIIFYTWCKISLWRKRLKKETEEAYQTTNRVYNILKKEIEKQIEFLDKKPGLTNEEKEVRDKLQEIIDMSKKFINKEIKDIEKELK